MTRPDDPWTDPGTGQPLAIPRRESAEPTGYRYQELWQASARAAGWVPLADVLDALRDHDGFVDWTRTKGPRGYLDDYVIRQYREACARYLAERFAPTTAAEGADERNGHG